MIILKSIVIGENDAGQRLDKFLTKTYPNLPQSMLYKSIRKKDIKCNGKRCDIATRLCKGDTLTMYLKDEFFQKEAKDYDFLKAPNQLNILYEDENLLLLDKSRVFWSTQTSITILTPSSLVSNTICMTKRNIGQMRKIRSLLLWSTESTGIREAL